MALQYEGDQESNVRFGTGWEQYKILVNEQIELKDAEKIKNICGVKESTVRIQTETTKQGEVHRAEQELIADAASLALGFDDNGIPELSFMGEGTNRTSEWESESSTWMNEESKGYRINVFSTSLESLFQAFQEIEALQLKQKGERK